MLQLQAIAAKDSDVVPFGKTTSDHLGDEEEEEEEDDEAVDDESDTNDDDELDTDMIDDRDSADEVWFYFCSCLMLLLYWNL